jgi:SEC-C motif domain protein
MPDLCSCCSGKSYAECCRPFHEGERFPESALLLMRSRYSAYALGLVEYVIQTTHPDNPLFKKEESAIKKEIMNFCQHTEFKGLDILHFIDGKKKAYVTFVAHLQQLGKEAAFQEKSVFLKVNDRWLYLGIS